MELKDILYFDTETTGVTERSAKWDEDFNDYPHIVQLSWIFGCKVENHIIRPEGWEIPEEATKIHGITTEYAIEHGVPFALVVDMFVTDCLEAGLICAHNIHFDTSIIKANILRELGWVYYNLNEVERALYKGKRLDTMRSSMKWVDARTSSGRLKFPSLTELYSRCFPGKTFEAHNALEDTKAVAECLPILVEKGLVELKVKEYDENPEKKEENARNAPNSLPISEDDKILTEEQKTSCRAKLAKITSNWAKLLDADDF